jgi:5-bromo-4-chloroindolyl phosphate hydrolysis protein
MAKAKRYTPQDKPTFNYTKGTVLYIFVVPLFLAVVLALFQTNIQAFILNSISFFLFLAVATLAKRGFIQEGVYHQNTFTKAPKVPYKMIAGYLLGGSTFFTAMVAGSQGFMNSAFLAIIATVGYYLFYGFDPKSDKFNNLGDVSSEFVLETIKEAKDKLSFIENDMKEINDTVLYEKLNIAVSKAKNIIQTIQEDPKDVRVARKFLIVYLDGIAKVTDSYTALDETDISTDTKTRLHSLMDDVEKKFDKELKRLKNNNEFDLDVHIDVLKEQINN